MLDIGCGTGNEALYCASLGFRVTGIDLSSVAIQTAREKASQSGIPGTFLVCNALSLPFASSSFDFILDKACHHFIPPALRGTYAKSVSRVLHPNGMFVLYTASDHDVNMIGPHRHTPESLQETFGSEFLISEVRLVRLAQHFEHPQPYLCLMTRRST